MGECVFCKIISGETPSMKLYEDQHCIAFMDINPVTKGHTLLVPKKHYSNLLEACQEELMWVASRLPVVAKAVVEGTGAGGFSVVQLNGSCAGQVVPHLHFHIIPRKEGDGVSFHWEHIEYEPGEMERIAESIRGCLAEKTP